MATATQDAPPTAKRGLGIPILFTFTAFAGAGLLFLVEPLVAKLLLPSYGGAATVWTTSTFFFQAMMLASYLLIHGSARFGPKRQPLVMVPLILGSIAFLPLALPADASPGEGNPILKLVLTLLIILGLPFAVLGTTGPLMQKWYSWSGARRAHDPYFLYAASNVGSFVGLLAYPFLVEPNLSLADQKLYWSWAFGAFALLVALCGVLTVARGRAEAGATTEAQQESTSVGANLAWGRQGKWLFLAFVPSSLMLGVTSYLTTDVASFPLMWIVPLSLYLLTMIAAFGTTKRQVNPWLLPLAGFASIAALLVCLRPYHFGLRPTLLVAAITLTLVAYAAHRLLAADRPEPTHLTRFFVIISLGGALGGAFNGLLAPVVFDRALEYPLVLALVPLLLMYAGGRRLPLVGAVVVLLALTITTQAVKPGTLYNSRTFYGSYTVVKDGNQHHFYHGTTLHGAQVMDGGKWQTAPQAYYGKGGPLSLIWDHLPKTMENVTVVGLGAGGIAAYGEAGMAMHFIDVDPEVVKIAKNPDYFTFLRDSKADITTEVADGRLAIADLKDGSQDLIIMDAFSSDSIPVHLLTEEAFQEYMDKLTPEGSLVVHVSNRVFDLAPVVNHHAQAMGMTALFKAAKSVGPGATSSSWMIISQDGKLTDTLLTEEAFHDMTGERQVPWTDDYSSLLTVMDPTH